MEHTNGKFINSGGGGGGGVGGEGVGGGGGGGGGTSMPLSDVSVCKMNGSSCLDLQYGLGLESSFEVIECHWESFIELTIVGAIHFMTSESTAKMLA